MQGTAAASTEPSWLALNNSELSRRGILAWAAAAALGALGIVYADIGTSPLYALSGKRRRWASGGELPSPEAVFASSPKSLWSLILVVSFKYAI